MYIKETEIWTFYYVYNKFIYTIIGTRYKRYENLQ